MHIKIVHRVQIVQVAGIYGIYNAIHLDTTARYAKNALLVKHILLAHALDQFAYHGRQK